MKSDWYEIWQAAERARSIRELQNSGVIDADQFIRLMARLKLEFRDAPLCRKVRVVTAGHTWETAPLPQAEEELDLFLVEQVGKRFRADDEPHVVRSLLAWLAGRPRPGDVAEYHGGDGRAVFVIIEMR